MMLIMMMMMMMMMMMTVSSYTPSPWPGFPHHNWNCTHPMDPTPSNLVIIMIILAVIDISNTTMTTILKLPKSFHIPLSKLAE